ncbi:acyl-CoA dehydrogenase family protein [Alicycliphilus denitrificans]|uniref:acyl-CoA dehydrogenase family protein n=1 Tax=Alicycliphilus denitrificans TaxID=179636 RepID=UPI00384DAECE
MGFLLNEEQTMLRDSAQAFLSEQSPVTLQRQLRDDAAPLGFAPALWQQVTELGWPAATLPEHAGGLAMGYPGLGAIFELMGRHLAALPLLSHSVLAAELLLQVDDAAQQAQWLPLLARGGERLALALDESQQHRSAALRTRAEKHGDGWRIDGDKWFVIDGLGARWLIIAAQVAGEAAPALFVVDSQAEGVALKPLHLADSRNHARITLQAVQVNAGARLALSDPAAALERALDCARACLAAEAHGIAREVLERTVAYLKERVQFDVAIGSFQALQHRVARLYTEVELLDSCVRAALSAIDACSPELPLLASLAKARANDLCERLLNEAVQLHGGIGVTDEFDLGLFLKRARVLQQSLGDTPFHRERYARLKGF